jgi:hypothetical protein
VQWNRKGQKEHKGYIIMHERDDDSRDALQLMVHWSNLVRLLAKTAAALFEKLKKEI